MEPGGGLRRSPIGRLVREDPSLHRLGAAGIPLLFFLAGLAIYGVDLDHPDLLVLDEVHYVRSSWHFANGSWMNPSWNEANPGDHRPWNFEHPPLGKYWMALAIQFGGDDEQTRSYRIPGVLYAAAGLAGLSVLSRRLFGSHAAGILAPMLLLSDPMWFVHARTAILEIYVAAPMIWAFAFALGGRRWEEWAAAGAAGLGLAAKYTALFLLPALFLVLLWRGLAGRSTFRAAGRAFGLSFGIPWLVAFLSAAPFLWTWWKLEGGLYPLTQWLFVLGEGFEWGSVGPAGHPEHSPPLLWLPLARPTWYYVSRGAGEGTEQATSVIYAIGNPIVWWGGLVVAVASLTPALLRFAQSLRFGERFGGTVRGHFEARDWRVLGTVGVAALLFVVGYLPHFALSRDAFLYYMTLLVPYLALLTGGGLALGLRGPVRWRHAPWADLAEGARATARTPTPRSWPERLDRWLSLTGAALAAWFRGRWSMLLAVTLFGALAAALFAYWSPLFTGYPASRGHIERVWDLVFWMEKIL